MTWTVKIVAIPRDRYEVVLNAPEWPACHMPIMYGQTARTRRWAVFTYRGAKRKARRVERRMQRQLDAFAKRRAKSSVSLKRELDATGNIYRAPEDEIPEADKARFDGYERGKAESDLEVSRLYLQVAAEREMKVAACCERDEAVIERKEMEDAEGR